MVPRNLRSERRHVVKFKLKRSQSFSQEHPNTSGRDNGRGRSSVRSRQLCEFGLSGPSWRMFSFDRRRRSTVVEMAHATRRATVSVATVTARVRPAFRRGLPRAFGSATHHSGAAACLAPAPPLRRRSFTLLGCCGICSAPHTSSLRQRTTRAGQSSWSAGWASAHAPG